MSGYSDFALYVSCDGYAVIFRALQHYRMRLRTISQSPEVEGAAMFAQILQQEASRTGPLVDALLKFLPEFLYDPSGKSGELSGTLPLMIKSMDAYCSGIRKAMDSHSEYYVKLLGGMATGEELQNADRSSEKLAAMLQSLSSDTVNNKPGS